MEILQTETTTITGYKKTSEIMSEIKILKKAIKFHKKYIYVDSYFEECDENGPIQVYCYISKKKLGNRDVISLKPFEYDVEIGPYDDIRVYCGPMSNKKIEQKREELENR